MTQDPLSGAELPEEAEPGVATESETTTEAGSGDAAPPEGPTPEQQVAELTADLQRLQAEYINYKKRVDRDRALVLQNAKFTVMSELLPVLDAIDRAREHGELERHDGFRAVAEALEKVVESQGMVKFGAPGDAFDPHRHEALMHEPSTEVSVATCRNIVQSGYQIGERVVRPALVTVIGPEYGSSSDQGVGQGADRESSADAVGDAPSAEQSEGGSAAESSESGPNESGPGDSGQESSGQENLEGDGAQE